MPCIHELLFRFFDHSSQVCFQCIIENLLLHDLLQESRIRRVDVFVQLVMAAMTIEPWPGGRWFRDQFLLGADPISVALLLNLAAAVQVAAYELFLAARGDAVVAAIGSGDVFSKGRDFAAWLGLVPKQISTGDRTILGKISKRGNRYLRVLFVQAAWVVLLRPKSWERYGLKPWIEAARKRLHHNVLAIALANKLARIAWSVLARGRGFEARSIATAQSAPSSTLALVKRGSRCCIASTPRNGASYCSRHTGSATTPAVARAGDPGRANDPTGNDPHRRVPGATLVDPHRAPEVERPVDGDGSGGHRGSKSGMASPGASHRQPARVPLAATTDH